MSVKTTGASCRIQADAIVVSSQQVFAPGQIVIQNGRIVEVTQRTTERADIRLNDCMLLPGLINPHTHLEFSQLTEPLPVGEDFPQWIGHVLALRQQSSADATPAITVPQAIAAGLHESYSAGVVAIGDIVTPPWHPSDLLHISVPHHTSTPSRSDEWHLREEQLSLLDTHLCVGLPKVIAFLEQLGLSSERRTAMANWRDQLWSLPNDTWPASLIDMALSPHAPYSTPLEFCRELSLLAHERRSLLAMHLLESPAERQWIDAGTGPMAEMLARFGAAGWQLPRDGIDQLCAQLSQAKSALLIHGNFLTSAELDCVAEHKNLSMVYCPRTHQRFGHQPYPIESIQQRDIRLLLGTDSRSTNPDLNLWQEARVALALHPNLQPSAALSAITDAAATALDLSHDFGSLQVGRMAAINAIRLTEPLQPTIESQLEQMFESSPRFALNAFTVNHSYPP